MVSAAENGVRDYERARHEHNSAARIGTLYECVFGLLLARIEIARCDVSHTCSAWKQL